MPLPRPRSSGSKLRELTLLTALAVAVALATGTGTGLAGAATLEVSPSGSDANDCLSPATACATIQHAVDEADAGDTVDVAAGTYGEVVTVAKPLTLEGAQAGVDARKRTGVPESVLNASGGGFAVLAADVTIDGFTVQEASGGPYATAVYLSPAHSGYRVANNVLRDNVFGLYANTSGATPSLIERNRFEDNNRPGSASGNAIYTDNGSRDLTVQENFFTGHESAAVVFAGSADQSGLVVSDNQMVDDNSIALFSTEDATISGNTSTGSLGSTVFLGGGNVGVVVEGNRFLDGTGTAVRVTELLGGPNQNLDVLRNVISGNAFGIRVDDGAHQGSIDAHGNSVAGNAIGAQTEDPDPADAIDASENWWGCNEGPGQPGCDTISSGVGADPWLVLGAGAEPASVFPGQSATVVARLDRNSNGAAASLPIADSVAVGFTAAHGSMSPASALTAGGVALSTYVARAGPGDAGATVSLDSESVPVALTVAVPPPPQPPSATEPPPVPSPKPVIDRPAARTVAAGAVATVGTITCPAGECTVSAKVAFVTIGGKRYKVKILVPAKIQGGETVPIRVLLPRAARRALKEAERGRLVVKLTVAGDDGKRVPTTQRVKLKPKG